MSEDTPPSDAVSNDVERVARAIWTAPILGQPIGYQVRRWPPSNPDAKVETYRQARAAIASLSSNTDEVTEAMIEAGRAMRERQRGERYQNEAVASNRSVDEEEARELYLAMRSAR